MGKSGEHGGFVDGLRGTMRAFQETRRGTDYMVWSDEISWAAGDVMEETLMIHVCERA